MREIDYIVIHCTATSQETKTENIIKYWKNNLGWKNPGYHYLIEPDGTIKELQPEEKPSNGVRGYNSRSVHISYIGGKDGDDRTEAQKKSMERLIKSLTRKYPKAIIQGHRDFPNVSKSCPNFEVSDWLEEIGINQN